MLGSANPIQRFNEFIVVIIYVQLQIICHMQWFVKYSDLIWYINSMKCIVERVYVWEMLFIPIFGIFLKKHLEMSLKNWLKEKLECTLNQFLKDISIPGICP